MPKKGVFILLHEAKALLDPGFVKQLCLPTGKTAPVVSFPLAAK